MLSKNGKNSWIVQWIGYNDLTGGNLTPAAVYANITTYIGMAHALGIKVALCTETEGSGTGGTYQQLNTLILANAAGADAIIPQMALDPVWQATGATPQQFISGGAGPHPTTYGYGFVASDIAAGLLPTYH